MTAKTALIYFSNTGTTELLAEKIRQQWNPETVIKVQPLKPYRKDYPGAFLRLIIELLTKQVPVVQNAPVDLSGYDAVFVGYPVWADDMPVLLKAYLQQCNLNGTVVIPFTTSGMNTTAQTAKSLDAVCAGSVVWKLPYSFGKRTRDNFNWWRNEINRLLDEME